MPDDEGFGGIGSPPDTPDENLESPSKTDGEGEETATAKEETKVEETDGQGDEPEEYKNALTKHKGDKAAMARDYWRIQGENAAMARMLKERASPPREEPKVEEDPALLREDGRIKAQEDKIAGIRGEQREILAAFEKAEQAQGWLKGRVDGAEALDKPEWESKLSAKEREIAELRRDYRRAKERFDDESEKLSERKERRASVLEEIKANRARQKEAEADFVKQQEDFLALWETVVVEAADKLGVPKTQKIRGYLREAVYSQTQTALAQMDERNIQGFNVAKLVTPFVERYADAHDLIDRRKFREDSDAKRQVAGKPAPARKQETKNDSRPAWQKEEPPDGMARARARLEARYP